MRRRQVVECEIGLRSAWFSPAPIVFKILSENDDIKWMRCPYRKRPTVPRRSVDDVLARLDVAGVQVDLVTPQ